MIYSALQRGTARLILALAFALLAACAAVGPEYRKPAPMELPTAWDEHEAAAQSAAVVQWWQLFRDPVLNELIARGARQNLSVEAAALRIVQARAALGISDALNFPQVQQLKGNYNGLYRNEDWLKSAGASLDAGWEIDVWGKYARGVESAEATLYASIASYQDVLVSISAEIARNYIGYRTAQERMYLSQQNIAIQERVVAMTEVQFESGNVSELDVQQAKTQLYATQGALPSLKIAQEQARNALGLLLGTIAQTLDAVLLDNEERAPRDFVARMQEAQQGAISEVKYSQYSVIPRVAKIPDRIDSRLLLRRPDLQVAEMQARAQSARIGQAQADLYPQFSLLGSVGVSQTVTSGKSFDFSDAVTASIGPGLSWNIFNYDRIKNRVRIEDAAFQESLTNYNQSVLAAVRDVSDALQGYRYSVQKSEFDYRAVEASIRAFNISATQYNNGLVNYQRLLSTVEKMTLREDVYAQTRGGIANQVVALYKALGGGWQTLSQQPLLQPQIIEEMRGRTDWGDYLDARTITGENRGE